MILQLKSVNWPEFIFFPIVFFSSFLVNIILSLINNFFNINFFSVLGTKNVVIMSDFSINLIIIFLFLILEKKTQKNIVESLEYIKKNIFLFMFLFTLPKLVIILINYLFNLSNVNFNLSKTENQMLIIDWIKEPNYFFMKIIIFLSIILVGPISEEILYRHLIIGELGKIFSYKLMAFISIILFSLIHVSDAKSSLEILTYLILSLSLVLIYLISKRNIFVSITLHCFINITSYAYIYYFY